MNKIRNRKNNKGFSLVELIIVIAIMAILAGILIPQFVKYISSSKVSGDIQQAENIYNAVAAQYADSQGNAPTGMTYDGNKHIVDKDVAEALVLDILNAKMIFTGAGFVLIFAVFALLLSIIPCIKIDLAKELKAGDR